VTVLKRPDRKARPWYYKFKDRGVLYKEAGFRTQREAQDAEAAARLSLQNQRTRTAFSQAVKLRLDHVQAYCTPQTYRQNITRLKPFRAWQDLDLTEITPDLIRARLVELSQTMINALVNKHLIALRSVFEQAVNDGRLGRNPCRGLKFLPVARKVNYVPATADLEKVLALASEIDRSYLVTIWQLGARVREVNNLTWEDVDFNRRQVRLWTRKKRGGHKTPRLVDMNDRAFAALKLAQWHRTPDSPYVFINPRTGRPWDYRAKFFDSLCRQAGIREMGYHALRHQKASALADTGHPLPYIRDFLGHEDISTTSLYLQSLGIKK
jgi:integrase